MPSTAFVARNSPAVLEKPWGGPGRLLGAGLDKRASTLACMDEYPTARHRRRGRPGRLPALQLSLSRVGVTGVEKVIRIRQNGVEQLFSAQLECFVDLGPRQKGAHMSRFEEVVNDAIGEVILGESAFRAETLAQHIAEKVRERQDAHTAEVTITRPLPGAQAGAGVGHRDAGDLHAARLRGRRADRHAPADRRHRDRHDRLPVRADAGPGVARASGWSSRASPTTRSSACSTSVPVATHNQRGLGTLRIGCPETCDTDIDALRLVEIVEASMSSEIYELMKRSDEAAVVEKAHRRPRFVEDCVREMIGGVRRGVPRARRRRVRLRAPGEPRVDPPAQRRGRALRPARRAAGRARDAASPSAHHVSMREWLDGAAA